MTMQMNDKEKLLKYLEEGSKGKLALGNCDLKGVNISGAKLRGRAVFNIDLVIASYSFYIAL